MERNERLSLENELGEFLAMKPASVPEMTSEQILNKVKLDLHPPAIQVFLRVLFIQVLVGLITLLFCPQFGISLTSSRGIMPSLMTYGEGVCMFGCGAFFTALSLFAASFALQPEEVRTFKHHEVLQLFSLSTLSLGAFICVGGEVVLTLGLIWLLGAVFGGALTLETGWALRQRLVRRVKI